MPTKATPALARNRRLVASIAPTQVIGLILKRTLVSTDVYIAINDMPKLDGLKQVFPDFYRDQPVLMHATSTIDG